MTPAGIFATCGRILYGPHYRQTLADALKVSRQRVDDWSKGRGNPPPHGVWNDLLGLLQDRANELPQIQAAAQHFADYTAPIVQRITLTYVELRAYLLGDPDFENPMRVSLMIGKFQQMAATIGVHNVSVSQSDEGFTIELRKTVSPFDAGNLRQLLRQFAQEAWASSTFA